MAIKKTIDGTLQVDGRMQRKVSSICSIFLKKSWQYYTNVRLYYRSVKNWMVKIWQIFGQLSISSNFHGTKVSLHMIVTLYHLNVQLRYIIVFYCVRESHGHEISQLVNHLARYN